MIKISNLHARQILDSRGNPTIEVDCMLDDESFGRSAVPSGVSAGQHEALELRDGDKNMYRGKGVLQTVENVNTTITDALKGQDVRDHRAIDQMLLDADGTPNKSRLGANAILGVSMAVCRARAVSEHQPLWKSLAKQYDVNNPTLLPMPMMVILEGGEHSDCGLAIQENMIVPTGVSTFSEAIRSGSEIFYSLQKILTQDDHVIAVGIEGGCAPRLHTCDEAFTYLERAIDDAGYTGKVQIAIDAAASEFVNDDGTYAIDGKRLTGGELTDYYEDLFKAHPIISLEDSHAEDDWDGFIEMKKRFGDRMQLVGDDLLVTNTERIKEAVQKDAVNSVLIKVNQIGSVTETVDAIKMTQDQGWTAVVSHRGGDTSDTFIADLSVGLQTGQIKTGSVARAERTSKYNQLLRIEEQLGESARYESPF
jgi:enolase